MIRTKISTEAYKLSSNRQLQQDATLIDYNRHEQELKDMNMNKDMNKKDMNGNNATLNLKSS